MNRAANALFVALLAAMPWSMAAQGAAPASAASAASAPVFMDVRDIAPIMGDAQAGAGKVAICSACHGHSGMAVVPQLANLAGQPRTYLYVQLKSFKDGQRSDPVMTGQAARLSDQDMRDIATYYASFAPATHGGGDESSPGARLYHEGDPARGIPPCQGCHGPDAKGPQPAMAYEGKPQPPWYTFPYLHGQSATFIVKALSDFRSGTRAGTSNARVMQGVTQSLTDDDIQALSAYLSSL
jgi:cytochrome c553